MGEHLINSMKFPLMMLFLGVFHTLGKRVLIDANTQKSDILDNRSFLSGDTQYVNSFEIGIGAQEGIAHATPEEERILQTTSYTTSYNCSTSCIDLGKNYCPTSAHSGAGTCCESSSTTCPRVTNGYCSKDITLQNYINSRYWVCGNHANCSTLSSYIVTPKLGTANAVTIAPKNSGTGLTNNVVCSWLLTFPSDAYINDTLTFRVNYVTSGTVSFFVGNNYSDTNSNVTGGTAVASKKYVIYYP